MIEVDAMLVLDPGHIHDSMAHDVVDDVLANQIIPFHGRALIGRQHAPADGLLVLLQRFVILHV